MTVWPLFLAAIPAVEVWTGGDDGLTQRYADKVRQAVAAVHTPNPFRLTVEQIVPGKMGRLTSVISFSRDGQVIGKQRCKMVDSDDGLAACAARVAAMARAIAGAGR